MRVLIATDAWHPRFLTPDGFPSVAVPTYPGLRCALPNPREVARRIEATAPDAIHIATEGPIGHIARRYCLAHGLPFTTSYTTRYPEYISARFPFPEALSYAYLRRFHAPACEASPRHAPIGTTIPVCISSATILISTR
jgi:hypothetical protein